GIVQWYWKNHYFPELTDQFNSIHEQLVQSWTTLKPYLKGDVLYFSCAKETLEDLTNVEYLRDTALQAGIETKLIYMDDIGWRSEEHTSELQSRENLVCRLLLEKKNKKTKINIY